jgi:hypothetical protein
MLHVALLPWKLFPVRTCRAWKDHRCVAVFRCCVGRYVLVLCRCSCVHHTRPYASPQIKLNATHHLRSYSIQRPTLARCTSPLQSAQAEIVSVVQLAITRYHPGICIGQFDNQRKPTLNLHVLITNSLLHYAKAHVGGCYGRSPARSARQVRGHFARLET